MHVSKIFIIVAIALLKVTVLFLRHIHFWGIKKDDLIQPLADTTTLILIFSSTVPLVSDSDK